MKAIVFAVAVSTLAAASVNADELTVTFGDIIKPDTELSAFIGNFRAAITAKKPDYAALDGFFAPSIGDFSRGLDPLQPWHKSDPITGDRLKGIIDTIVEQAPLPDDAKQPDYRPEALSMMANMIAAGPLGAIKEAKGQACAPAAYKFDKKAVAAYVKAKGDSVNGLRFYKKPVQLMDRPDAKAAKGAVVQPGTIVSAWSEENVPDGWAKITGLGGSISGYMKDSAKNPEHYLNEMHVCFGKVDGQYKLTSIFGYGL